MHPIDCAESGYYAKEPAREHDLHLPFLDFIRRHGSWRDVVRWVGVLEDDIGKMAASLAKIELFAGLGKSHETAIFISTEVEYLFGCCRSAFDDLQKVFSALWERVHILDEQARKRKKTLPPDSFRKVAQKIRDRGQGDPAPYGLADALVRSYERVNKFFFSIRDLRDGVIHRGRNLGRFYVTERGHAVDKDGALAALAPNLKPEHDYNEKLVSLRPVLAHLVCSTIYALNDFSDSFSSVITFPASIISPEYTYFLRLPHSPALLSALSVLRGEGVWPELKQAVTEGGDQCKSSQ
jgi:hypothetical protein